MRNRRQEDLIRETVREILIQESFLGDILGGIKSGIGKAYDVFSDIVGAEEPKSGILKALDDLSPDSSSSSSGKMFSGPAGQMSGYEIDDSSELEPSPIDGVMQKSGVVLNDYTAAFVKNMRAALDKSIPLTLTSGDRSEAAQASAMYNKYLEGGRSEIEQVYGREKASEFFSVEPSESNWLEVIRKRSARGARTSPHMRGAAVDIRTKGLSSYEVQALVDAAEAAGGKTLLEDKPEHLHVTIDRSSISEEELAS